MEIKINNRNARRLWIDAQGLSTAPTGPLDLLKTIKDLGFVQLDTIQVVARAHHHILWSRNQNYREDMLDKLMRERGIFEHFTHDASVLPMDFLPMWRRQFRRKKEQLNRSTWFNGMSNADGRAAIKARIAAEGALSTQAFDTKVDGPKKMWARPPHKLALDYMWYTGELATCHRKGFTKFYDLATRVFPDHLRDIDHPDADQIHWLCTAALERLGVATAKEIQEFWDAVSIKEVREWVANTPALIPISVQAADGGWSDAFSLSNPLERDTSPTSRLRIINPFDPLTRDRSRLKRLFGFDYRVEMFVPAVKRKWGYYVYPLLEGDRFVGRIEVKADRAKNTLTVLNQWTEDGIKWTDQRAKKLDAELARMARFVGVETINWPK